MPIENSLEGSVNATLDALVFETDEVTIVGEVVHPIRHCLIARRQLPLEQIERVVSHPQASGQCARFLRERLPRRRGRVRRQHRRRRSHRGRLGRALGGARNTAVGGALRLRGPGGRRRGPCPRTRPASSGWREPAGGERRRRPADGAWKTSIVFWGLAGRARRARRRAPGVRRPRGEPEQDRVAAAQAGARPLHLLRRPRGRADRARDRRRARRPCSARSRRCACSAAIRPHRSPAASAAGLVRRRLHFRRAQWKPRP